MEISRKRTGEIRYKSDFVVVQNVRWGLGSSIKPDDSHVFSLRKCSYNDHEGTFSY